MVNGKDVLMYVDNGGEWLPYLCSTDVRLRFTVEMISKTTKGSGKFRNFFGRKKEWSATFSGVTGFAEWSVFDSILKLGDLVNIKIEFTDNAGTLKTFLGAVIFGEIDLGSNAEDFSDFTHEMQGTGGFMLDGLITDTNPPLIQSAVVTDAQRDRIVITYNESVSSSILNTALFSLNLHNVVAVNVSGNTITLITNQNYKAGDIILFSNTGGIRDLSGNYAPPVTNYPVINLIAESATFTAEWGWDLNSPYNILTGYDDTVITNWQSGTIYQGQNVTTNFTAMPPYRYVVMKEPISEPVKTSFEDTGSQFNNGLIPSSAFRSPITVGGFRYYISRNKLVFDNNATSRVIFKK